jgi:hypothetical protein
MERMVGRVRGLERMRLKKSGKEGRRGGGVERGLSYHLCALVETVSFYSYTADELCCCLEALIRHAALANTSSQPNLPLLHASRHIHALGMPHQSVAPDLASQTLLQA